jgi:transmembrane sensor
MEQKDFYRTLVQRYLSKQLTDKELDIFVQLTKAGKLDDELLMAMNAEAGISVNDEIDQPKFSSVKLWLRIAAAASIVIAVGAGLWFYKFRYLNTVWNPDYTKYAANIRPGKNTATLLLSNGKVIRLNDNKTGIIIDANKLTYNDGSTVNAQDQNTQSSSDTLNGEQTISTPNGGAYQLRLPDGTKVWLNAASSLTYSNTQNMNGIRKVKLIGEAYFEVTKDKTHPFIVECKNQIVEVLGTHFNINTYDDEPLVKTTLLEGKVQVKPSPTAPGNTLTLKPNQQAILSGSKLVMQPVDANESVSWKNGKFTFDKEEITSIMRKVARWYDVQIVYQGNLNGVKLTGSVSRFENITKLLEVLEQTQEVHFKIEPHKIIVTR